MSILNTITQYIPKNIKKKLEKTIGNIFDIHALKSYSQEGEDMILRRIFEGKKHGFYVDIGAHHPLRFSNTNIFYQRGWNGINIDPNPEAIQEFKKKRPRDINLQLGVSDQTGSLKYYFFDEPALNTFDENIVKTRLATTTYKVIGVNDISVDRLDNILKKNLPKDKKIDFLSIDTEGFDLFVLRSNDWKKFRPEYVLTEALNLTLEQSITSEIFIFMKTINYELFAKTYNTFIFFDKNK